MWTLDDDKTLLSLRASGTTWTNIAEYFDAPKTNCFRRHDKLTLETFAWTEEMELKLRNLYQKHRESMWSGVASEMGLPWKVVEDKTWDLGKKELVKRI